MTPNRMLLAALLLPAACSTGVDRKMDADSSEIALTQAMSQDPLTAALDMQDRHAEERRRQLAREAGVDVATLSADTKRLMRQEARSDRPTPASLLAGDDESAARERHQRRQRRHHNAEDTSALIAGDPGQLGQDMPEDESDKDAESPDDGRRHCPDHYKVRGAEAVQPLRMGIFWRVKSSRLPLWENTNKEYMYFAPDYLEWRIGDDYRQTPAGVASTPNEHAHCPHKAKDWYAFYGGNWTTQFNITVAVEECPIEIWVTGVESHQPKKMGTFYMTLHEVHGRPVYENENHMFLYYWPEFGEWRIGEDFTKSAAGVASKRGEHLQCPNEASSWSVFYHGQWFETDLHVLTERPAIYGGSTLKAHEKDEHAAEQFHRGAFGENQCPLGTREMSEKECEDAAAALGTKFNGVTEAEDEPRGCIQDQPEGANEKSGHLSFNGHPLGMPREEFAPLCHTDLGVHLPTHAPKVQMRAAAPATSATSEASQASQASQAKTLEADDHTSHTVSKHGAKSKVAFVVVAVVLLIFIVWFIRRRMRKAREAKQEADERKSFAAEDQNILLPQVNAKVLVKSLGRKAVIIEEAPDLKFKVRFEDDNTESELLEVSDLEVLEGADGSKGGHAGAQKGQL